MKKTLLAFADALEKRSLELGTSADHQDFETQAEQAEYIEATAAAGAVGMLIAKAIRDVWGRQH